MLNRVQRTLLGVAVCSAAIILATLFLSACGEEKKEDKTQGDKGQAAFQANCASCHSPGGTGGAVGPALDNVGAKYDSATIVKYVSNPQSVDPNSKMPALPSISSSDLQAIGDYLATKK